MVNLVLDRFRAHENDFRLPNTDAFVQSLGANRRAMREADDRDGAKRWLSDSECVIQQTNR